jgi:hypothetical protein
VRWVDVRAQAVLLPRWSSARGKKSPSAAAPRTLSRNIFNGFFEPLHDTCWLVAKASKIHPLFKVIGKVSPLPAVALALEQTCTQPLPARVG